MQQKLVRSFWNPTSSGLLKDTCEIVKLPPRYASLFKEVRNLPKETIDAQSSNCPSHPSKSRIDDYITGLEANSQRITHGDGPKILCQVPLQELLRICNIPAILCTT